MSVFHGARPQSSMSLRNSTEWRTIAECIDALLAGDLPHLGDLLMQRLKAVQTAVVEGNWNLAQHLELIPTTGSNAVTQAELSAAQRTQLDQMRLQQGGKSGGKGSIRAPPRDSAREEDSQRQVLQLSVRGSRKGRWRSSHHTQAKVRSPVPVQTPKLPPPLQKARPRSSPARSSPSFRVAARKNMSRSPSAGRGSSPSPPQCGFSSPVAACCSAGGDSRFSLRNTVGQESQFQKKRRAKNTSAQVTMGRKEEISTWNESFPLTGRKVSGTFWVGFS